MPYGDNFRAPKVDIHQFSMVPRSEIPRSRFAMQSQHKTTFSASKLIPVFVQEILPGDTFNVSMTAFCRMATPVYPIMDNMDLESWFFFVPCRLVWSHWKQFMGEQTASPADSISFSIPQIVSPASGYLAFSVYDYFGIPGVGQIGGGNTYSHSALPLRAYNMIWNEWFRDQNLDNAVGYGAANTVFDIGDGPDPYTNYTLMYTRKRHDYFTSCLPWTQKGGTAITIPLGLSAPVKTSAGTQVTGAQQQAQWLTTSGGAPPSNQSIAMSATGGLGTTGTALTPNTGLYPSNLYADLSQASAATINQLRTSFQTQKLLERDARGGTRYAEVILAHFGVRSPDFRVQRPEYLGGGRTPVNVSPVPQTGGTGASGTTSPLGTLAAVGTAVARRHGFRGSFTEHGYVIGLVAVRADPVYQQGVRRLWTRLTRYDFFWPVFSMLGEQAVRQDEMFATGVPATDSAAFGFQEHWAEYRYFPSMVSGAFRSTYATPLDAWHLAERFSAPPALNSTFIQDKTATTLVRNLAAGALANDEQFLADLFFEIKCARPMPMYSVPGLIDHF